MGCPKFRQLLPWRCCLRLGYRAVDNGDAPYIGYLSSTGTLRVVPLGTAAGPDCGCVWRMLTEPSSAHDGHISPIRPLCQSESSRSGGLVCGRTVTVRAGKSTPNGGSSTIAGADHRSWTRRPVRGAPAGVRRAGRRARWRTQTAENWARACGLGTLAAFIDSAPELAARNFHHATPAAPHHLRAQHRYRRAHSLLTDRQPLVD
jgi:hypothetical protein